uniref:Uncharacterized protein n=1 Tax=Solanum tuberosum TaxID=4113 RepID=M1DHH7_SOLTU
MKKKIRRANLGSLRQIIELVEVRILGTFAGYLYLKRIWEKESNLGELGLENEEENSSGKSGHWFRVVDLLPRFKKSHFALRSLTVLPQKIMPLRRAVKGRPTRRKVEPQEQGVPNALEV